MKLSILHTAILLLYSMTKVLNMARREYITLHRLLEDAKYQMLKPLLTLMGVGGTCKHGKRTEYYPGNVKIAACFYFHCLKCLLFGYAYMKGVFN